MDASNLLKPMLARGELHTIGATTLDEYRKHIEKDAALERRFQPVLVDQPTVEETICDPARPARALRGPPRRPDHRLRARRGGDAVRPLHHRALPARQGDRPRRRGRVAAADGDRLDADRARRARAPPDPARDRARGARARRPTTRRRRASRRSRRSWPTSRRQAGAMKQRWEAEKAAIAAIRATKSELEALQVRIEQAERETDYATAAELKYGTLTRADRPARRAGGGARRAPGPGLAAQGGGHAPTTSPEIVAAWTGIPVSRAAWRARPPSSSTWRSGSTSASSARTRRSQAVSDAVRRARAGPQDPRRPHRLVPVPRPDRRRQDRARPRPRRVPVRRRARDGPDRHERVHGEVRRVAPRSARRPATSATTRAAS